MGALSDPKLEKFAQALLCHLANGMTGGKAATQAALEAGYSGSSLAANARKRAQRKDVKARMVELAAPRIAEAEAALDESMESVTTNLFRMALKQYDADEIKPEHSIKASDLLAKLKGAYAPEKVEHSLNGLGDRLDRAIAQAKRNGLATRTEGTVPRGPAQGSPHS
jgi:phage terminase small subunit